MSALRLYLPDELGADGYPPIWHDGLEPRVDEQTGKRLKYGIKHGVRDAAGCRCVRCGHPYRGGGQWSSCDEQCTHSAPVRATHDDGATWAMIEVFDADFALAPDLLAKGLRVEAQWRILTVHHLDGDKANCRWWNLAALCQRCHLQIQGRVLMERVWPWEHTAWFQPYVAGYYALTYLGQEITRAEAEARLDELLALERIAA